MPAYRNIQIRAITESAAKEAGELGLNLYDIAAILSESYDCAKGRRKEGVEERCARRSGKILKVVIELKTSKSGFEYWRIRHIGFVG
ncbi:MAG TPA: hypothetical protein VJH04_03465 [archaeon]|nr:hypothetical protein [archaeon]